EPLISPALINQVAGALDESADMSTACHAIHDAASLDNPNVVKVVLDARGHALYFSRSRIPYPREAGAPCYRHAGIYGYRVGFLRDFRSEEHTSELQSQSNLVCRLLLEKKKKKK